MYQVDIKIADEGGSICMVEPVSDMGQDWVDTYLSDDTIMLGNRIAVEHRYIESIYEGMEEDGLHVVVTYT